MLTMGLILNPVAGIGGAAGLKGSDGDAAKLAEERGYESPVQDRTKRFLSFLLPWKDQIRLITCSGVMGGDVCNDVGWQPDQIIQVNPVLTTAEDTRKAVSTMKALNIGILVFAGGDGTARDVYQSVGQALPVIGIPSGVKMHSAVFGIHPEGTAELVRQLINGCLVNLGTSEVRDLDEVALRSGKVKSQYYGELLTPQCHRYLQSVKCGGVESKELVRDEIAAFVEEHSDPAITYFIGAGTTTQAIKERLIPGKGTLLGVDVIRGGELLVADADEKKLLTILDKNPDVQVLVSFTGGQGYLFGRGNQQFSALLLAQLKKEQVRVFGSRSKVSGLEGRPLRVDTGNPKVDRQYSGLIPICVGYDDFLVYSVES